MQIMGKCRAWYDLISSSLGVLFSITAFVAFFWVYENVQAGTWAAVSGVFAAICLQLHILYWTDRLENYHTPHTLNTLEALGFVVMLGGVAVSIWYIFAMTYWHKSILPVKESLLICAVWSIITSKWGLTLFLSSKRYSSVLRSNFTPLRHSI